MSTAEEQAVALKNEGNKAFVAHDWPTAVEFYSKAIALNDKEPAFYANRAQVSSTPHAWRLVCLDRVTDLFFFHFCRQT